MCYRHNKNLCYKIISDFQNAFNILIVALEFNLHLSWNNSLIICVIAFRSVSIAHFGHWYTASSIPSLSLINKNSSLSQTLSIVFKNSFLISSSSILFTRSPNTPWKNESSFFQSELLFSFWRFNGCFFGCEHSSDTFFSWTNSGSSWFSILIIWFVIKIVW